MAKQRVFLRCGWRYLKTIGASRSTYEKGFHCPVNITTSTGGLIAVVSRGENSRVTVLNYDEEVLGEFGKPSIRTPRVVLDEGVMVWATCLAFDSDGLLYVADEHTNRISSFRISRSVSCVFQELNADALKRLGGFIASNAAAATLEDGGCFGEWGETARLAVSFVPSGHVERHVAEGSAGRLFDIDHLDGRVLVQPGVDLLLELLLIPPFFASHRVAFHEQFHSHRFPSCSITRFTLVSTSTSPPTVITSSR